MIYASFPITPAYADHIIIYKLRTTIYTLQMPDINTLFATVMTVSLDFLVRSLSYTLLYVAKITTIYGVQLKLKLRASPADVFVIMPPEFSTCFSDSQISRINNEELFVHMSYWGRTNSGNPIIQIRNAAMPMPTYSEMLAAGALGH